jgi:hypothetical protein
MIKPPTVITGFFSIILFSLLFIFTSKVFSNPLMVDIYGNELISIAVDEVEFKRNNFNRNIMDSAINLSKINEAKKAYKRRGEIILGGSGIHPNSQVNEDSLYKDDEDWNIKSAIKKTETQRSISNEENIKQKEHRITLTKIAPNQSLEPFQLIPKTENDILEQTSSFHAKASKQNSILLGKKVKTKIDPFKKTHSKHVDQILTEAQNERSINVRIAVNDTLPIYPQKIEKVKTRNDFTPVISHSDIKVFVSDDLLIEVAKRIQ